MLIPAIQRTGEVEVRKFGGARRGPIRIVYPDGVGNGFPVRVDRIVIDGNNRTAGIEEDVGLQIVLARDSKVEGMHEPEASGCVIDGQGFQSRAVRGVDGAKTKGAASAFQVKERSEDGSVQLVLNQLYERGWLVRNF